MDAPAPRSPDFGVRPAAVVKPVDIVRDDLKKVLFTVSRAADGIPPEHADEVRNEVDRRKKLSDDLENATDELNRKKDQPVLDRRAERQR